MFSKKATLFDSKILDMHSLHADVLLYNFLHSLTKPLFLKALFSHIQMILLTVEFAL